MMRIMVNLKYLLANNYKFGGESWEITLERLLRSTGVSPFRPEDPPSCC